MNLRGSNEVNVDAKEMIKKQLIFRPLNTLVPWPTADRHRTALGPTPRNMTSGRRPKSTMVNPKPPPLVTLPVSPTILRRFSRMLLKHFKVSMTRLLGTRPRLQGRRTRTTLTVPVIFRRPRQEYPLGPHAIGPSWTWPAYCYDPVSTGE